MSAGRRGLVAPQNTFLDNIVRRSNGQHSSFLLANARIVEYPIVYCNDGFTKLAGFTRAEVMQKSGFCRFLVGDATDKDGINRIREIMENYDQEQIEIMLYNKNKTPLWLLVHIAPVKNDKDAIILYLLAFRDITALKKPVDEDNPNKIGLSKFARLARSVTKNRSVVIQFSSSMPLTKPEDSKDSTDLSYLMPLSSEVMPQYKQEAPKTPPNIVLHYSLFKTTWDWVILFLTAYTAIMVPFNEAFDFKDKNNLEFIVIDSMVDAVFFIDIILNFHTTFVGPNGEVISDPTIIRVNYLKGWFAIELLSCLPYDILSRIQTNISVNQSNSTNNIFNVLKVIRLLRMVRIGRKLDQYLEYGAALLILMIFGFVLLAHWSACIWYSIGIQDLNLKKYYGWIPRLLNDTMQEINLQNVDTINDYLPPTGMMYLTALYYTLSSLTSIGFGNVAANTEWEKAFTIVFMIIGALAYATIFGKVTTIFQQLSTSRALYDEMINSVKDFIKIHDVPQELGERVIDYVTSSWAITKGIDTAKVLSYCPKDMRADICVHLNRKVFNEHPAFRLASDGCLRSLAMKFVTVHTAPGDLIFHQGESLDQLCFVVTGSLEVIQDDEVVAILGKGDVFGDNYWREGSIGQSAASVRALTYCDLHCIKRKCLMDVLEFYHTFANSFARNLVLTYNLRHRIIFRKLADLRREKELAEKRKDDPPLADLSSSHPVRKLISRFRKLSDVKDLDFHAKEDVIVTDITNGESSVITPNGKLSGKKWGRFFGGADAAPSDGSVDNDIKMENIDHKFEVKTEHLLNNLNVADSSQLNSLTKSGASNDSGSAKMQPNRIMSKWGKFKGNTEPIKEEVASDVIESSLGSDRPSTIEHQLSTSTYDNVIQSSLQFSENNEVSPSLSMRNSIASKNDMVADNQSSVASSLHDLQIELKSEMLQLHSRMSNIESQIDEILRMVQRTNYPSIGNGRDSCSSDLSCCSSSKSGTLNCLSSVTSTSSDNELIPLDIKESTSAETHSKSSTSSKGSLSLRSTPTSKQSAVSSNSNSSSNLSLTKFRRNRVGVNNSTQSATITSLSKDSPKNLNV